MSAGLMTRIVQAVFELNPDRTGEAVKNALQAGVQPVEIMDYGIARGVEQVGEQDLQTLRMGGAPDRLG